MSWKDEIEEIKEDISGELNKNPKVSNSKVDSYGMVDKLKAGEIL